MKKFFALMLAGALILLTGCGEEETSVTPAPVVESALNIQLGGEPDSLDPAFAQTTAEQSYLLHILEGLVSLSESMEPMPGAAESWQKGFNDEGLPVYTFQLNPQAKWNDGQAVTPQDFIYAWKRVLSADTASPLAYELYPILNAQAVAEGTMEPDQLGVSASEDGALMVTLGWDCPDFLTRLASPVFAPLREDVVSANPEGWSSDVQKYPCNGPYVIKEWLHDQSLTLTANEQYHNPQATATQTLNFVLSDDEQAVAEAYKSGKILFAKTLPLLELEEAGDTQLCRQPLLGTYSLAFKDGREGYGDPLVRQALSMVLDREELAAQLRDGSTAAEALIPGGTTGEEGDFRKEGGSLLETFGEDSAQAALELLKEAGWEDPSKLPTLVYLTNDSALHTRVAEYVCGVWQQKLGLKTEIRALGWDDYQQALTEGDFDVTRSAFLSGRTDPGTFLLGWITDGAQNVTGYSSQEFDQLVAGGYGAEVLSMPEEDTEGEESDESSSTPEESSTPDTQQQSGEESEAASQEEEEKQQPSKIQLLHQAEELLVQKDRAVVPLFWYGQQYLAAEQLINWYDYPNGWNLFIGAYAEEG